MAHLQCALAPAIGAAFAPRSDSPLTEVRWQRRWWDGTGQRLFIRALAMISSTTDDLASA